MCKKLNYHLKDLKDMNKEEVIQSWQIYINKINKRLDEKETEIERLNNIINELENYIRARADDNYTCSVCSVMTDDLLNILKGDDKK